jgi:superfamily II DNA or RNA helicase
VALSGKSETRALQRIGGLMRPYPGKDTAITFDIWDSAELLYKQGEARKKLYENEPYWRIEVVEVRRKRWLVLTQQMSSLSEGTQ